MIVIAVAGIWSAGMRSQYRAPRQIDASQKPPKHEAPPATHLAEMDLLDPLWQARDEAAGTMVFMAERRAPRVGDAETQKEYERVVAMFPESHWADVARKRTLKMKEIP
jgi:hypothetical protein